MSYLGWIFSIQTANVGVRTTFGKYTSTLSPGLNWRLPLVHKVFNVPTCIRQDQFRFRVKTLDNAFSTVNLAVQYKVEEEDAPKALFSMANPRSQIESYIENVIRSNVPKMTLDGLFKDHDSLCNEVRSTLGKMMKANGYTLHHTLITDISPDKEIQNAMNSVIESERRKQAAANEAEAVFIKEVRKAEADRDRKRLQGEGVAQQRRAIMDGYRKSLREMRDELGISAETALNLTTRTMYYDTLERIGTTPGTRALFLNHSSEENSTQEQVRNGLLQAKEVE